MIRVLHLLLVFCGWSTGLLAQFQGQIYKQEIDAAVVRNATALSMPWCGGF